MPSKVSSRQSFPPDSGKGEPLAQPSAGIAQAGTEIILTGKNPPGGAKRKREGAGKSIDKRRGEISKKVKGSTKVNEEEEKEEATVIDSQSQTTPKRAKRSTKAEIKEEELVPGRDESSKGIQTPLAKRKSKATIKQEPADVGDEEGRDSAEGGSATPRKAKRKRKTKEEKEAEAMPIAARTTGLRMFIGAHVSSAKGWSQRSNKEIGLYIMRCELQ